MISGKNKKRPIILSITCMGISSIVTQIIFIREFLNVFSGNELVLGLILCNWLLLTGLGSFIGRYSEGFKNPIRWLVFCQIAIALLPPIQIIIIRLLKQLVMPGFVLGIGNAFLASLILLIPYCLVSGFLLTLFASLFSSRHDAQQIGDVFVLDTLGDIIGGLIFSFIFIYLFNPFQTVAFLLIINLLAAIILSYSTKRRRLSYLAMFILISTVTVFWQVDFNRLTGKSMFPGQELLQQFSTPYGHLAITQQEKQITVYENGIPIGSTDDPITAEEIVHYSLSQISEPKRVLLLSGGLTGALREIEKYGIDKIDYVELDPGILEVAQQVLNIESNPRLTKIAEDARRFVKSAIHEYDAILVDLPDPSTARLNRFYTVEFFSEVKSALSPEGVFSFSLSGAENYANPQIRLLSSAIYHSLESVFPHILIVPGAQQFFVASEKFLDYNFNERLINRGIETDYVNEDYLSARLTKDRIDAAKEMVSTPTVLNRDFFPGTYFAHLQYWLSQFGSSLLLPALFIVGIVILLGVFLAGARQRVVPMVLSASGFSGMGLEVILLIVFQICYGYVFKQVGLIITAFMIGSAAGALWSRFFQKKPQVLMIKLDILLSALAFVLGPLFLSIHAAENNFLYFVIYPVVFPILTGIVGFLTGAQFPLAAKLTFHGVEKTTGSLYAFDLLGASLGALLVSTFCIPLIGITTTCYLIGGLKLITAIALRIHSRVPEEVTHLPPPEMGKLSTFGIVILVFITIGAMIVVDDSSAAIYAFSFSPLYHGFLFALLVIGIVIAMELDIFRKHRGKIGTAIRQLSEKIYQSTKLRPFRWITYLAFAPVVFFALFRCYFKIPYLFCHVCPRLCVFGFLRPYLVPAALIMNIQKRLWCFHACPIGTLYHCQAQTGGKAIHRFRFFYLLALAILFFTVIAYFKILWDLNHQPVVIYDWYTFFFKNTFAVSSIVIFLTILFIILGYRLRRTFCETLCPVGTFSDLLLRFERSFYRKERTKVTGKLNS